MSEFASDVRYPGHDWATRLRIPLICTSNPMWAYEVALLVPGDNPSWSLYDAVWPTEEEATLVGAAIDYRRSWYREGYAAKMLERPFDVDGGTNTVVLCKREDGWVYTKRTYDPPMFYPAYGKPNPHTPDVAGLRTLLAFIFRGPTWDAYVAEHADLAPSDWSTM